MNKLPLKNILKSQEEYHELVQTYKNIVEKDDLSVKQIAMMLDEIKCFWLERLKIIDFELEELTEKHSCFLLSGAIYLNVADYEHYYFKSFGDHHLLFDPFLKMERFFRIPEKDIDYKDTISYFKKVYADTMQILTNYKNIFYILPIKEIAIEKPQKHNELLNRFFWKFISTSFNNDYENEETFCSKYHTFEEIEKDLADKIKKYLIFNEADNDKQSLRKRIEQYFNTQLSVSSLIKSTSEAQSFLIAVYSFVSQIMDILLICAYLRIYPYIRFSITFNYLTIIMYTFTEDKTIKDTIEKSIIFYIFRNTIEKERFDKITFPDYCKRIENLSLMDKVQEKMHSSEIDIFKGGIKQVSTIIKEEFDRIIEAED